MLGALCYAELGTMIPKSGGEFAYLLEAFGAPSAFLYSWTSVTLLRPSQTAIIALAFGKYVAEPFFPSCMTQDADRQDLNVLVKLLAALCIGKSLAFSTLDFRLFFTTDQKRGIYSKWMMTGIWHF